MFFSPWVTMVSKHLAEPLKFFGTDGEVTQWQIQVSFAAANNLVTLFSFELENPALTEWDRFRHREYIRISMEEDASNGSADIWDESLEAPF
ncbi:hypothetical protein Tco_1290489 [Tanacetum coccineum]